MIRDGDEYVIVDISTAYISGLVIDEFGHWLPVTDLGFRTLPIF